MHSNPSTRGAVKRPLLLFVPLVIGLGVLLLSVLNSSDEPSQADIGAIQIDVTDDGAAGLRDLDSSGSGSGDADHADRAESAIAAGRAFVRLRGRGVLTGVIVMEGTEIGVAGVRVRLLATPPSGDVLLGRILRLGAFEENVAERTKAVAAQFSDSLGNFSFEGVRSGRYFIDALGPAHSAVRPVRVSVLESGSGGPAIVEVRPAGSIRGLVLEPDGTPALGVTIVMSPGPGHFLGHLRDGSLRLVEVEVDESGAFHLEGVAPGKGYEISAASRDHTITHAVGLEVRAGEETQVTLRLRSGGRIAGLVLSVAADDEEEREDVPLAGAQVAAIPRGLRDIRMLEEIIQRTHATTDAAGRYVIEGVPEGDVDVLAIGPGHMPGQGIPLVAVDGVLVQAEDVRLRGGPMVAGVVLDSSGVGIEGVQVRWRMVDFKNMEFDFSLAPMVAQAVEGWDFPVSDAEGLFVAGPCAGDAPHKLRFLKPGFASKEQEWDPEEDSEGIEVVLLRGGVVEGIVMDLERAEPVKEFTIAGMDRVMSEAGEPGRFNPFSGGEVYEDPAGRFRFEGVKPGSISLSFQAEGYLTEIVDEIVVLEGEPTRGVIVMMQPGGVVRGLVLDAEGLPVRGAQVIGVSRDQRSAGRERRREGRNRRRAAARSDESAPQPEFDEEREFSIGMSMGMGAGMMPPAFFSYAAGAGMFTDHSDTTDAQGAFELTGLEPGKLRLYALHPEYAGAVSEEEVEVVAGEPIEGIVLELEKGGGAYGTVEDGYGRPLPGTVVFALSPNRMMPGRGSSVPGGLYEAGTDENGEYKIENMVSGSYIFVVARGDDQLNFMSFLGNMNFDLVTIPKGRSIRYDIVDDNASGCRVHGIVYDGGEPVRRGAVTALSFESDNILGVDFKLSRIRSDGSYEFPGLKSGEYTLQVQGVGREIRMELDVPDQSELQFDLHLPEGGVEGEVVAAESGEPVAGATVFLRPLDQPEFSGMLGSLIASEGVSSQDRTDSDGRFEFERISPGEYELIARPGGWRGSGENSHLAAADPIILEVFDGRVERNVEIALPAALVIRGTVVDSSGAPILGARVAAARKGTRDPRPVRSQSKEDGSFVLTPVSVGTYTLSCTATEHSAAEPVDVVVSEEGGEARIVMEAGVEVHILVLGSDGAAVRGARGKLTLTSGDAGVITDVGNTFGNLFSGEGATGEDGRAVMGRYRPGTYELEVWSGFQRVTIPDVVLEVGAEAVDVTAQLP